MRQIHLALLIPALLFFLPSCGTDSTAGSGPVILPPENFTIVADSDSSVTLSWELTGSGEEQIILDRRIADGTSGFSAVAGLHPGTEEITVSPLNPNLGYQFRWRVTGDGEEAVSDTITIRNDRALSSHNQIGTVDYSDEINSVAFGPLSDSGTDGESQLIAFGSTDARAEAHEISGNSISLVQQFPGGHTGLVSSVAFHPAGGILATASHDNTALFWNISSGETVQTLSGHFSSVRSVGFDGEGSRAVTAGRDGNVVVWDTEDGSNLPPFSNGTNYETAALSQDGSLLAAGGHNQLTVDLWEVDSRELTPLTAHTARILSVDFSPDGELLASAGEDNSIRLWSVSDRSLIDEILSAHSDNVNAVAFGPGGRYLVSGGAQSLKVWDLQDLTAPVFTFTDHIATVRSAAISPDGTLLASGSVDNRVFVYRLEYSFFGWEIEQE